LAPIRLETAADVEGFGVRLASLLRAGDVVLLNGDLGAGKTTLARGLLRGLGLTGEAPSPTFSILQGYEPSEVSLPVGHVDLYRISEPEIEELGLDDWLADGVLVIEWPDRLGGRFVNLALNLQLAIAADGARLLTAHVPAAWEGRWPLP
jgi:tRNA threonylcarbamoyladenosine biosynthesis protein TsaE